MTTSPEALKYLEVTGREILSAFTTIADLARDKALKPSVHAENALINPDFRNAVEHQRIQMELRDGYLRLAREPAIARIRTRRHDGVEHTYYVCRSIVVHCEFTLANYYAPVGRLASLEVGDELSLKNGSVLEVLERALVNPYEVAGVWDSQQSRFESDSVGTAFVSSLLNLLAQDALAAKRDHLAAILASDAAAAGVRVDMQRVVITRMGLRDQPVLDKLQDEVFRLPLDSRLLILGPAGSGKTTTMIRRLGQKIRVEFLTDEEQEQVAALATELGTAPQHSESWLMFTPTELLKQYLKEAFARENVPAPDSRLATWTEFRRELGRNTFGVLRSATGRASFVLNDNASHLDSTAIQGSIAWFEDFDRFQLNAYWATLEAASKRLSASPQLQLGELGDKLSRLLSSTTRTIPALLGGLTSIERDIGARYTSVRDSAAHQIHDKVNALIGADDSFLGALALHLKSLKADSFSNDASDGAGEDVYEDEGDDDDDDVAASQTEIANALNALNRALRLQARAFLNGKSVAPSSRAWTILQWLGNRGFPESELRELGEKLNVLSALKYFQDPAQAFSRQIGKRYKAFRRDRRGAGHWYTQDRMRATDLHPLELDIILLALLRNADSVYRRGRAEKRLDQPAWEAGKVHVSQYRNQIYVDEASDFSPVQLASMALLANPRCRSFFACGDLNQRLTVHGTRSGRDFDWAVSGLETRQVSTVYRQTRSLLEFAAALNALAGDTGTDMALPQYVSVDGPAPVLLENAEAAETAEWLAARILEIETFLGKLPSIAVFVNSEDDVTAISRLLQEAIAEHNIAVTACREGQVVGQEANVRIFSVQHIKGLEFEAVFFLGVDKLRLSEPELFHRFVYVGATRAATYLGIACEGSLPKDLESLRSRFQSDWA